MQIIFRCDDIYLNQNKFETKLFELFQNHDIPLSVGIIPFNKENLPYRTTKLIIPANIIPCLHGFNHTKTGTLGEFDGLPLLEQERLMKLGKDHLEFVIGDNIECFIPPWNKYDKNTLNAARSIKLRNISGGHSVIYGEGNEIPCGVEHFNLIDKWWFRILLNFLPNKIKLVVLFHNFNFEEHTKDHFSNDKYVFNFMKLERLLVKLEKGRHEFIGINDVCVNKEVFSVVSDIIKKLTGQRIRFWI